MTGPPPWFRRQCQRHRSAGLVVAPTRGLGGRCAHGSGSRRYTYTLACIAGAVAEAIFGVPDEIEKQALRHLTEHLRQVIERFQPQWSVELIERAEGIAIVAAESV